MGPRSPQNSTVEDVLPLSPLQQGMLFHALYDEHAVDVYTGQMVITLAGPLQPDRLRDAAGALLARHANLRVAFRTLASGTPVQVVRPRVRPPWREVDLSSLPEAEREAAFDRLVGEDRAAPFDTRRPPLLRFTLVRLDERTHRLLFSSHHIVLDGWSTPIVVRELFALYAAEGDGTALAPVRAYRDYLTWLSEQDADAAREYWRRALDGLDGPTLLAPQDTGRRDRMPERISTSMSEQETAALTAAARRHGLTVNTVVQGMWAVLLGTLTGRADVVFGATVSGRPADLPDVESMVGLFINTVPVRVRLRPEHPTLDLLTRTQAEQAELLDHHHVGLGDIQRAAGHDALFDTLLVFENYPLDGEGLGGDLGPGAARVADVTVRDATHYPLTVIVLPGSRLTLNIGYQPDAVPPDIAHGVATWLTGLLRAFVDDPHRLVGRLDLTPPGSDVITGPVTGTGQRAPDTVRDLLRTRFAATPDAVAVRCGDDTLDYAALARRAAALADALAARGAGPESVVGIALPRSVDLVVALVAVLEVGAAYLPIDTGYPPERIELMLADAAPALVVCEPAFAAATGLAPDRTLPPTGHEAVRTERGTLRGAHPSYVVFTSGSTGRPKAVVGTQRALANRLAWDGGVRGGVDAAGPDEAPRVRLAKSPLSFIDGTTELLGGLVAGDTVVLAGDHAATDPLALADLVDRNAASVVTVVPSLLAVLADVTGPDALATVRTWVCSGEALTPELVARAEQRWPRARLVNLYGCSEVAGDSLAWHRERGGAAVALGTPIPNTRCVVLDHFLRPVPDGVTGELYLAGDGLARGYLAQPARTAERFVADPFGPPGARMYRTGDLVRRSAGGEIEFAGRADDQLKIRGFRVEPAEVEAAAREVAGVANAVAGRTTDGGTTRLVLYVVPAPSTRLDVTRVRAELARRLPGHAVPAAVVTLDSLPTTPSGKLDRRSLPAPDLSGLADRGAGAAPRTETETVLCELFAEILGVPRVGVHDSFFELGGDSILSVRLVSRAARAGVRFSPRDVFTRQSVAELAAVAAVDAAGTDGGSGGDGAGGTGQAPDAPRRPLVSLSRSQLDRVRDQVARRRTEQST